jgi:hypothetical protein
LDALDGLVARLHQMSDCTRYVLSTYDLALSSMFYYLEDLRLVPVWITTVERSEVICKSRGLVGEQLYNLETFVGLFASED